MEKAIKKAIEGGYGSQVKNHEYIAYDRFIEVRRGGSYVHNLYWQEFCYDPLFWQALGKAMGWRTEPYYDLVLNDKCREVHFWKIIWHRFIEHLAEGKDADSFFNYLLK
jgi:hypothetical protein